MRNLIYLTLLLFTFNCFSQVKESDLVLLAEAFHEYHWTNNIDNSIFEKIDNINSSELSKEKEFIAELIRPNNDILNTKFLIKPDLNTLGNIFIIRALNYNMFQDKPITNKRVIEKVIADQVSYQEMLSAYYNMIFGVLSNKHDNLDLSKTNFDLGSLNLITKQEKGIFFLTSMERFGSDIWGFMNIPGPTDYKSALDVIKHYPKYNGEEYYKYNAFDFDDFQITVDIRKPKVSYKDYYLKKYLQTLSYHMEILELDKRNQTTKK